MVSTGTQTSALNFTDALVLVGGVGARLRPLLPDRPKPLASIRDRPFLDLLLDELVRQGVRRIILCSGYLRDQISKHVAGRSDAEIVLSEEPRPLGTGGAVRLALPLVRSDPFLVLNGDSFCAVDLNAFLQFHVARGARITLVVAPGGRRIDAGNVQLEPNGAISQFAEKAGEGAMISAGIYAIGRREPDAWEWKDNFSLERDVFTAVAQTRMLYGFAVDSEVIDIGTPERYFYAQGRL